MESIIVESKSYKVVCELGFVPDYGTKAVIVNDEGKDRIVLKRAGDWIWQ